MISRLDSLDLLCYIFAMRCKVCQNEFTPNKYHPQQQVCSSLECQKARQIQNCRNWRFKNPDYFKCQGQASVWRDNRNRYSKKWRLSHKEHLRIYTENHKEDRKAYMRDYMRQYRQQKNVNRDKI
jgi:hypothetical protein